MIDLYDSEIIEADKVLAHLNRRQFTSLNLEAFRKEAIERFAEIGLDVLVKVYDTNQEGVYAFDLEIQGRNDKRVFDPDRQVHEVTNDILGVLPNSEKGQTIKAKPGDVIKPHKH